MRNISFLLLCVLPLSLTAFPAPAFGFSTTTISEVAWMGTATSAADEWIELYNPSGETVDLSGWTLAAADGSPSITLSGTIAAGGFFLLERTNDDTVPGIPANQLYTGALSNTSEMLTLRDGNGVMIETIDASTGWPAGDNATKQTMERTISGSWQTSIAAGGTPGAANSVWTSTSSSPSPTSSPSPPPEENTDAPPAPTPAPTMEPTAPPPPPLRLSELYPNTAGNDSEEEFVEIENFGTMPVDLAGWKIRDASGKSLALSGIAAAGAFVAFHAGDTSLPSLNNDGDTIELLDPSGTRRGGIRYGTTTKGLALARNTNGSWLWTTTPTPNSPNVFTAAPSPTSPSPSAGSSPHAELETAPDVEVLPAEGETAFHEPSETAGTSGTPRAFASNRTVHEGVVPANEENDGGALAAALRSLGDDEATRDPLPPWTLAALLSFAVGAAVLFLRVWAKRRSESGFVVEEEYES